MSSVLCEIDQAIATIKLNRPEARNALSLELCQCLERELHAVARDPEIRAVVLTGSGQSFCAGGDLGEIDGIQPLELRDFINNGLRQSLHLLMTMPKPVIAAVNGVVAGAGIGLALACDHVMASDESPLVTAFGRIGLIPDGGVMYQLVRNLGLLRAKELVFNAQPLTPDRALELGLYNRVVPRAEFDDAVRAQAKQFAAAPTRAIAMAKNILSEAALLSFDAFMETEINSQALASLTQDHQEGIRAFLEKRDPKFLGN